ncbi:hypothetical protein Catovirus_1_357 [Catovirus CTV1]|uniref:Uncharacterized protein n=1 Tax=Catovirus CTV1 TaxID=1977631 RepID=A0A1V0S9C0_9VIRU|nr:hypothetical protein Catovirus_1_357 [Catovirus CTV1]
MDFDIKHNILRDPVEFKKKIKNKTFYQLKVIQEELIKKKDQYNQTSKKTFLNKCTNLLSRSFWNTVVITVTASICDVVKEFVKNHSYNNNIVRMTIYSPYVFLTTLVYNYMFNNENTEDYILSIEISEKILEEEIEKFNNTNTY